ncbi:MAG: M10 family metallopeptidase C-terminal domain-containing protein [Pseudomonadota bacterium]
MPVLSVAQILSGTALGVNSGLDDLFVLEIGGGPVLYLLNRAENRLIQLDLDAMGAASVGDALSLTGTFEAGSSPQISSGQFAAGGQFLALSGMALAEGQIVTLSVLGDLGAQQSVGSFGALSAATGSEVGSVPVLLSASANELTLFSDVGSGFSVRATLADQDDRYLTGTVASATFVRGGANHVATISATENAINLASFTDTDLMQVGACGNAEGLPITTPSDLAVVTRPEETALILTSFGTSSVSIVLVDEDSLALADHVLDAAGTRFQGASAVATVTSGDFAYAAVGGAEGGVSLFTLLPGGRLIHLDAVAEDETVPLDKVSSLEAFVSGSDLQIFAGSALESGLTRLQYDLSSEGQVVIADTDGLGGAGSSRDDQIIGSIVGEELSGLGGDDILLDGQGSDTLTGGSGADLFAFVADGVTDQVTDFERGVDKLDLSAFDFLYDVSQLSVTTLTNGAELNFGSESLFVFTADGLPLTAGELSNEDILNVDRPPFLLIGREIIGTPDGEVLAGGAGNDTIASAGGNDSVNGGFGLDLILGSLGEDTLKGNAGRDTLFGGADGDLLFGGDGDDIIYGDDVA